MQITLYKDCPIPNDYSVVWNNFTNVGTSLSNVETAHDKLLDSLSSVTITLSDVYLDDSGELPLDIQDVLNTSIWYTDYNYMSYEIPVASGDTHEKIRYLDNSSLTIKYIYKNILNQITSGQYPTAYKPIGKTNYLKRYAFIDSINYYNSSIKIKYTCDIWSTYSSFIEWGTGKITRFSENEIYKLMSDPEIHPLALQEDYFSNSALKKYNLSANTISSSLSGNRKCYCLATVQYYTLDAQGEQTDRRLDSVMIAYGTSSAIGGFNKNSFIATVDEWNTKIIQFMTYQSVGVTISTPAQHYEIQDIYLIPVNLSTASGTEIQYNFDTWIDNVVNTTDFPYLWLYSTSAVIEYNNTNYYYLMSLAQYCDDNSYAGKPQLNHSFEIMSGTVTNDFKRAGIGFITHMIPIECNNPLTEFKYSVRFSFDCCNINLYLEANNKIIELTEDLHVKIPIQVATADVTQLQAIQREIANKKNVSNAVFGVAKGVGATIVGGVTAGLSGGAIGGAIGGGGIAGGIVSTAQAITNAALDDKLINANTYTTNKSIDANSVGYLNAYYGFLDFYIDSINDDEVNNTNIKDGFIYNVPMPVNSSFVDFYPAGVVLEMVDNIPSIAHESKINYVRMSNVFIKGPVSQEIRNALKNIIENGFRFITHSHALNYESYL